MRRFFGPLFRRLYRYPLLLRDGVHIRCIFRCRTPSAGPRLSAAPLLGAAEQFRWIRGLLFSLSCGTVAFAEWSLDPPQWYWCFFVAGWFTLPTAWKHRRQLVCMQLVTYPTKPRLQQTSFTFTAGQEHRRRFLWRSCGDLQWDMEIKHGHVFQKYQ